MKAALFVFAAMGAAQAPAAEPVQTCPRQAAAAVSVEAGPPGCEHAISTKGTGVAGRASADHAINTKGTGTSGRSSGALGPCGDGAADAASSKVSPDKIDAGSERRFKGDVKVSASQSGQTLRGMSAPAADEPRGCVREAPGSGD